MLLKLDKISSLKQQPFASALDAKLPDVKTDFNMPSIPSADGMAIFNPQIASSIPDNLAVPTLPTGEIPKRPSADMLNANISEEAVQEQLMKVDEFEELQPALSEVDKLHCCTRCAPVFCFPFGFAQTRRMAQPAAKQKSPAFRWTVLRLLAEEEGNEPNAMLLSRGGGIRTPGGY
jgi:hypothetical protein